MASKNKTEKLGLNLWEGTDRPQRGDFNSDNMIVDEALGGHIANGDLHLSSTEKERVKRPVATQSYIGSGEATLSLSLGTTPSMVVVYCDAMPFSVYDGSGSCTKVYGGVAVYGAGGSAGIKIEGNTLKLSQDASAQNGVRNCLNEKDRQYRVAVVK